MLFPVILISGDKSLDILSSDVYFKKATRHTVNSNSYVGCKVLDSLNECYVIDSVADIGRANSFWSFDFFNPMLNIELKFRRVPCTFNEINSMVKSAIEASSQFWEEHEDISVIKQRIQDEKSIEGIIRYLKSIRQF
ncbi:hypothetical protein [Chitinophaga caseinilytica]|uniref:hypothetical protein n=1 Tax=Chitinophaga caseinilytica TaxID=2267521 RepID=UPI003C2F0FAF